MRQRKDALVAAVLDGRAVGNIVRAVYCDMVADAQKNVWDWFRRRIDGGEPVGRGWRPGAARGSRARVGEGSPAPGMRGWLGNAWAPPPVTPPPPVVLSCSIANRHGQGEKARGEKLVFKRVRGC